MHAKVKRAFDQAATSYDQHALAQQHMAHHLLKLIQLQQITPTNILDLGCGSGMFTSLLNQQWPSCRITAIDHAPQLLAVAKQRCTSMVEFLEFDFNQPGIPNYKYDLITANMSLQWANSLTDLLNETSSQQTSAHHIAFSIPINETFKALPARNNFYHDAEISNCLHNAGYMIRQHEVQNYYIFYPDQLTALRALKKIGAQVSLRQSNHQKPQIIRRHNNNPFYLNYRVLFIVAKKYET